MRFVLNEFDVSFCVVRFLALLFVFDFVLFVCALFYVSMFVL